MPTKLRSITKKTSIGHSHTADTLHTKTYQVLGSSYVIFPDAFTDHKTTCGSSQEAFKSPGSTAITPGGFSTLTGRVRGFSTLAVGQVGSTLPDPAREE